MSYQMQCIRCGSYALNIEEGGPYCDVCHWRNLFEHVLFRYEALSRKVKSSANMKLAAQLSERLNDNDHELYVTRSKAMNELNESFKIPQALVDRAEAFCKELADLMDKYDVDEMDIEEITKGYFSTIEGIEITFNGKYDDEGTQKYAWGNLNIGQYASSDNLRSSKPKMKNAHTCVLSD